MTAKNTNKQPNLMDRDKQIRDTMEAFMAECRAHGSLGYAMSSGYLQATVRSLLDSVSESRLEYELGSMRDFIQRHAHSRTMSALKQPETA
jgi:hypothetical protein